MKKITAMILSLMMVLSLAACGEKEESQPAAGADLSAFYNELAATYNWISEDELSSDDFVEDAVMMMDLTEDPEFLNSYFPGLSDIPTKQLIAKASMISAIVNEYVFAECESEEDAAKVAEILQNRVTMQAEGGAMYPESVEAWEKAQVVTNGTFVAMIASAANQAEIVDAFNALFA